MAFGPIMRLKTDKGLQIELAPFNREDVGAFLPGMQKYSVVSWLSTSPQTLETEQQWYDKLIEKDDRATWGIWSCSNGQKKLIGNTTLSNHEEGHIIQCISGCVITDKEYWGKGVASAAHRARTWFAFEKRGVMRIKSAVLHGNVASKKALEGVGYNMVYVERNEAFKDGKLRHLDNLECLNPADWAWRQWWGDDRPTRKSIEARKKTEAALEWAEKNVTLL